MVFHGDPGHQNAPRYLTLLRGWRKPHYLLVDRPKVSGRYVLIHENQPCVMRFISGGAACAFDSSVIDWDSRQQNPFCRIAWPQEAAVVGFRKNERVPVRIQCEWESNGEKHDGILKDISIGGCCLRAPSSPTVNSEIMLSFRLPNGAHLDAVRCAVQSIRETKQQYHIGCAFTGGQVSAENEIAFFVMSGFNRADRDKDRKTRILIISDNEDITLPLKNLLEFKNVDPVFATTTLDGLCRLRMAEPQAVCLDQAQHDLPGIETARMLRVTRGFEKLPIFILDLEGERKEADDVGIAGWFGGGTTVPEMVGVMTEHLRNYPPVRQ